MAMFCHNWSELHPAIITYDGVTNSPLLQHSPLRTNVNIKSNYKSALNPADENTNDDLHADNDNAGCNQHTYKINGDDTSWAASALSDLFEEVYSH